MFDFSGKVVVVTGSTKGIGLRIAERFLEAGAMTAVCGRSYADSIFAGCQDAKKNLYGQAVDVSQIGEIEGFLKNVIDHFGRIDILINNAGVNHPGSSFEVTEEIWDQLFDVNVKSYYFTSKYFANHILDRKAEGIIVNTASINAQYVAKNCAVYNATKAAVVMLTKSLALDWGKFGIRVNAVGPGSIPTDMNAKIYEDNAKLVALQERLPLSRRGTKDEIADAVLFLCSPYATYITGHVLYVDGGWLLT